MTARYGLIAIGVLVATAGLLRADDDLVAAYEKVRELYGDRIKDVQTTDDEADDQTLAASLLAGAADENRDEAVRFALADTAAFVAGRIGMPKTTSLAREAMNKAAAIRPYPPVLESRRLMELAAWRLDRLNAENADRWAKAPAARMTASAQLQFVSAAAIEGVDLDAAAEALTSAKRLIRSFELNDLESLAGITTAALGRAEKRQARFRQAEAKLAAARQEGSAAAIAAANVELAELWMEVEGDIAAAAKYLQDAGDPRAKPMATAAIFAAGRRPPHEEVLLAAATLTQWGQTLPERPKLSICELAMAMCQRVGHESDDPALLGRARVVLARLEQVAGLVTDDDMADQLAGYKVSSGRVERLPGGRVRVNYDFADRKQLGDWQMTDGQWKWDEQTLVADQGTGGLSIDSRLRFRADRPLRISFTARAVKLLGIEVQLFGWDGTKVGNYAASLGAKHIGRDDKHTEGVQFREFGGRYQHGEQRLVAGRRYEMVFELDGRGGCCWTVNDQVAYAGRSDDPARTAGSMVVRLLTASARNVQAATIDNILIEGTLLPSPTWQPSE